MTSRYYNMTDSTGASGFLPTVTFASSDATFTSAERIAQLSTIGITGFYEADFANNITVIDVSAFAFDTKVVVATINGVTSIRSDAFYGCSALRAITLDCSVNTSTKKYLLTDISSGAFQGCTSLRNLHIPDTIRVIPDNMCNGCTSLEVAVMGYGWARTGNTYDTSFNSVNNTIGAQAFNNCYALSYFVVPETVAAIGSLAFANNLALSLVTILGRPTIATNAFTGSKGAGAIYTFDNSASYVTLTSVTAQTFVPAGATIRAYREITINATSGTTVSFYNNTAAVAAAIPTSSWWKGKIASDVNIIDVAGMRAYELGAKYPFMIGISFPSSLHTIGYEAFGNWNSVNYSTTNVAAFYFPNSLTTFGTFSGGTRNGAFDLFDDTSRTNSTTRQFVFQSGTSTVALGESTFKYNSARAIILPNATSLATNSFYVARNIQLFSFLQKNAYTTLTKLDGATAGDTAQNAFSFCFTSGITGNTHYLYIPKQITRISINAFQEVTDKLYVTVYNNYNLTTDTNGLGFGYLSYGSINTNMRFTGTAPTFHLINNYYDANGVTLSTVLPGSAYHVLFPPEVKTINNRFAGGTNLKTVSIPDTVTDISASAFSGCTGLTTAYISPNSNLTVIGSSAFSGCTALTSFFIPNSLDGINASTFSGCTGLASVTFGDNPGIKYIGVQAFYNATRALTNIFIPSSVVFIGNSAFIGNGGTNILNTVTFGAGSRLKSIDYKCFGNDVNNISYSAQYLHDLVLPSSLRYMGSILNTVSSLLQNTHRLAHSANLVVPSSLEVIPWAFLFADNAPAGSTVDISNVYFPRSITNVAGPRKHNGYSVNSASISTGLAGAEFQASRAGSLIYLPSELSAYTGYTGYAFPATNRARSYYKTVSYAGDSGNTLTTLSLNGAVAATDGATTTTQIHADIKVDVTVIGDGATSIASAGGGNALNLISVNIPSTVTTISANAFNGCMALAYVTFSENSKLTTIGNSAFLGCSLIPDIQLPDTLTTIGSNAFSGCNNLASISIPYNVTSIGANAFAGTFVRTRYVRLHQKLYNDISGSLSTYFPGASFQVVPALTLTNTLNPSKLTISQINNMYIRYRQSQLGDCTRITVSASAGGSLTASDITNALSGSSGFVHLDISTNVTSINGEVCLNNSRIYSVAISKTVVTFGTSVFNGCTNLTYLSFHPDSVCTTIGVAAVHNTNIFDLALPDSLTTIGVDAFRSSIRLSSVCIPKNVTSLGANAFYNCSKLTSVALPSSLALATYGTSSYFNIDGTNTTGITFSSYSTSGAIAHFKLSDYSIPNGIVQNVVDSAVTYIDHRAYAYYPDITLYAVTTTNQTQTAGQYNYLMNGIKMPFMPAAFLLNGSSVVSNSMFPIYRSVPDLNVFTGSSTTGDWPENTDNYYILIPGYSICIYNNLYDEENLFTDTPTYRYYDNEFGKVPLNITINVAETTSSVLILFNGRILSKYFAT